MIFDLSEVSDIDLNGF